jgi:ribosomal protein S18 acetylase RimI-like enzyme
MTAAKPTIRTASRGDLSQLIDCARAFHTEDGHPLTSEGEQALAALLESDQGEVVVLADGARVRGYAILCFGYSVEYGGRDAFVDDLYVDPALRGHGYGKALYVALEQEARSSGCRILHLEVMPDNEIAAWYRSLGYRSRDSALLSKPLS